MRVGLLLLDARQNGCTRDARGRLKAHRRSKIVPQTEQELRDEELVAERNIECQQVVHTRLETRAGIQPLFLCDGVAVICASLTQTRQAQIPP